MAVSFKLIKKLNYFTLDVEFTMENELLVIEGSSGAGKTTILNCLAGIITPDDGKITIDDKPYVLREGDAIVMPAGHPHAVYANEQFKMLLVVVF